MRGRVPASGGLLQAIIERCLAPEPLRRYKDFEDLRREIEPVLRKRTGRLVEVPKTGEKNATFWKAKGASLNALGKCEEAITCFTKALEINPRLPRSEMIWPPHCLANKGRALRSLGRNEEALACYSEALEIDPLHAGAWNNKGVLLNDLGRYQEALSCCSKAAEIDPQFSFAWQNLGIALRGLGRSEEAIACFIKAFKIDPQYTSSCFLMGVTLSELNRYEEAIACYSKALEIDPRDIDAWMNKGLTLRALGRLRFHDWPRGHKPRARIGFVLLGYQLQVTFFDPLSSNKVPAEFNLVKRSRSDCFNRVHFGPAVLDSHSIVCFKHAAASKFLF